jgi:hypothetical protein
MYASHVQPQSRASDPRLLPRDSVSDRQRPPRVVGTATCRAVRGHRAAYQRRGEGPVNPLCLSTIAVLTAIGLAFAVGGTAEMQLERSCRAYAPTDAACQRF